MYFSTTNQLVTLSVTGSTAGFAVGDNIVVKQSSGARKQTNIRIAGFTGQLGRDLLVKLTSSEVETTPSNSLTAGAITPNYPFIKGDMISKVTDPSITASIYSNNWISQNAVYPYTFQDATWYGEPNYNPAKHELFTYSNGTYGTPTGLNSSFYEGTMFALTGTDVSCILMSSRPNVPFGWWNGLGSRISCLLTRQHLLNIAHYPENSNQIHCVSSDGTVHTVKKLSTAEFVSGLAPTTNVTLPGGGQFPTGLSACGNGVMWPSYYHLWYRNKTGRELYEDYDLDPYLFAPHTFTGGNSVPFGECFIQAFKTPLPENIKPALMPTMNCENQIKITNVVYTDHVLNTTLISSTTTRVSTARSNMIDELYNLYPIHLADFPEDRVVQNTDPYEPSSPRFEYNKFYSHLNEMPTLLINNTFARGFVRRSRLTSFFTPFFPVTNTIPSVNTFNTYHYYFIGSISGLNMSYSKNTPWEEYPYFEGDQGSYAGSGDSGSILFGKRNNRLVYFGGVFGASNFHALTNSPTGSNQVNEGTYCIGTSYSGNSCTQFDSSSYSLVSSPFVGVSHDYKKLLDIIIADKSWQVTTDATNAEVSADYRIFENDLAGHAIEWYDFADELLPLYLAGLSAAASSEPKMTARDDFYPSVVSLMSEERPIKNKPYTIDPPEKVGKQANQPPNTNLALPTNFKFTIKRVPDLSYFCTSVSLPGWSNPIISIPGGVPGGRKSLRTNSNSISHGEATFKFLVNEDMSNYDSLLRWFKECVGFTDYSQVAYRNWMSEEGHLLILSNRKKPLFKVTFKGLFPTNVSELAFKANETEATPMTATVTMAFTYYEVERLNNP